MLLVHGLLGGLSKSEPLGTAPPLACHPLPRSCADTLLRNLYRWVCSPASRLYDPALKQVGGCALLPTCPLDPAALKIVFLL